MAKIDPRIGYLGETIPKPVKAIRAYCIGCVKGSTKEVELCPSTDCPLYPFRFGVNPYYGNSRNAEKTPQTEPFFNE